MSEPLSIYIHYPWCITKCPYCDFNSYGLDKFIEQEKDYVQCLRKELSLFAKQKDFSGLALSSIFFGGGTPSLMKSESIKSLLTEIKHHFKAKDGPLEVTLEANPGSIAEPVAAEKLSAYREVGVNRISLGAQSFQPEKLKFLGRIHSPEDIITSVGNIKRAGFSNFNLDLIFGCKDEQLATWLADLDCALKLQPQHLSAYSLTIEPGTEFGRRFKKGQELLTKDPVAAKMYSETNKILSASGFERYEISNFAKPSFECQHNQNYWRGIAYLGLGAGAHSFLPQPEFGKRWWNIPGPGSYINRLSNNQLAINKQEFLNEEKSRIEFFFLRLRTRNGFSLAEHQELFGLEKTKHVVKVSEILEKESLLTKKGKIISLSESGFGVADSVIAEFAAT